MKIGRPRTLLGMVLMGLAFVTVPLLVAIGNAMYKLGQLAAESEVVLTNSATATLQTERLTNLLVSMERNARSYVQIKDINSSSSSVLASSTSPSNLLASYDEAQADFDESIGTMRELPSDPPIHDQLARLSSISKDVHRMLRTGATDDTIKQRFQMLTEANRAVATGMRATTNARLETLQENTRSAQQELLWLTAALIPGILVLVGLFLLLVGRPLRQIDRAIRELGEGDFGRPITVSGPHDIETLGRQLEWLRHRLKESTDEKNKFLRHMSHELKTPLANIREGTELLLDGSVGQLDREQQEVTGILRDNGVKLQKLIENLLM